MRYRSHLPLARLILGFLFSIATAPLVDDAGIDPALLASPVRIFVRGIGR